MDDYRPAELELLPRLHELMVAVLGHDLRNPISAILSMASVLSRVSDDPKVQDVALRLNATAWRASRMIDQLIDLSRALRDGGLALDPEPIDMAALLDRVLGQLAPAQRERGIQVECTGELHGEWDEPRMLQLSSSVLAYALARGASGHPVQVRADGGASGRVVLTITCSAVMTPEERAALFDPFSAEGSRHVLAERLGMLVVPYIAAAHGGTIDVRSSAADQRTAFVVELPRRRP